MTNKKANKLLIAFIRANFKLKVAKTKGGKHARYYVLTEDAYKGWVPPVCNRCSDKLYWHVSDILNDLGCVLDIKDKEEK